MLHAFVDESGILQMSPSAPDHFILTAVVIRDRNMPRVPDLLETIRKDLRKPSGQYLSFKDIRSHNDRLRLSDLIGQQTWLRTISVVLCKRHLSGSLPSVDHSYLYTLRFLLERLSWLAQESGEVAAYTLAQINGLSIEKVREYESRLRALGSATTIRWQHLDPKGGQISQPQRLEPLQLADMVASSTGRAFNGEKPWNYTERAYLENLASRVYGQPNKKLTSYGLKLHPSREDVKAAYPWIAALK